MSNRGQQWFENGRNRDIERRLRKQVRRSPTPSRVRRKDWHALDDPNGDDLDELDYAPVERIMRRGTQEQHRANLAAVLSDRQGPGARECCAPSSGHDIGIVSRIGPNTCDVLVAEQNLECRIRACGPDGLPPALGDRVGVRQVGEGEGVLEHILPRLTVLTRPDVAKNNQQQVIVANADQLLIVASWLQPAVWFELIDRYLIAAERGGLRPVVCINKVDLAEEAMYHTALEPYRSLDYPVLFTSAVTGLGLDDLRDLLHGQVTVLAGLSGVGKSSILSALLREVRLRVGEVSRHSGEGRHTTTQAERIALPGGGAVIDTPGIREFGLAGLRRDELATYYPEFGAVAGGCRFANCTHSGEPDCAVARTAGDDHGVSAQRYSNYLKILGTLPR